MLLNFPVQNIRKKFTAVMVDLRMLWRSFRFLNQHSCIECTISWLHSTLHCSHFFCFLNIHPCPVLPTPLQQGNVFILWQYFYHYLIYNYHNSVWRAITSTTINVLHSHVTMYSTSGWSLKLTYNLEKNISGSGLDQAFTPKLRLFCIIEMSERKGICVLNPCH